MESDNLELKKNKPNDENSYQFTYEHTLLRNRRLQLGLTQQQVADRAEIQLRQYQRVESGERHITGASARIMLAICAVLSIDPYDFFPKYKK